MVTEHLQSEGHRSLLDIIDKLRSQGISHYVDLPQIIVCGDQSSGKSSCLEAVSGISFPSKDNLCTRFATELILRRATVKALSVSIIPGQDRSAKAKLRLQAFSPKISAEDLDLAEVVERAKEVMGISDASGGKTFSSDTLRVELSGPNQPHLTMVDLPGLFKAANREQSEADAQLVRSLVQSYMKKQRSIILAVVSARSDFALQEVTTFSRQLDPNGSRTLGLITKPDQLDQGSDSERSYVDLAQNKDVKFRLGWHVLRNRDYAMRHATSDERDEEERKFFSESIWSSLNPSQLGVDALRGRLSRVLRDQILTHLPSVLHDVESGIEDCKQELEKLGTPRGDIHEQRQYLLRIASDFSTIIQASIDGLYNSDYFGNAKSNEGYQKRLRAVIQNSFLDFADKMRQKGHAHDIVEGSDQNSNDTSSEKSRKISRNQYMEEVKLLMRRSRGCELPGTFNPQIVGELFREQCQPWRGLIETLTEEIFDASYFTLVSAIYHIADKATAENILREAIHPGIDQLKVLLQARVNEILEPHYSGHPITYNHYLTESVQKAQAERRRKELEDHVKGFFGVGPDALYENSQSNHWFALKSLVDKLVQATEADMENYACSSAIDVMQAYYMVALKSVVDDVAILAIEQCLIQKLPTLFFPGTVNSLDDGQVQSIAAENEEYAAMRTRTSGKLAVLEAGVRDLQRLAKYRGIAKQYDDISRFGPG
jgi:GTPase SAR1 family protein